MLNHPSKSKLKRLLYENSLSLAVGTLAVLTIGGQALTGWHVYNKELAEELHRSTLSFGQYLSSGHFIEALFENWESEFLQMGLYVILTIWFRQKGSSESKKLYKDEAVDREPRVSEKAPWPVRMGGFVLSVYKNSLSIAFFLLFFMSFFLHALGGSEVYNVEKLRDGEPALTVWGYMKTSQFWFESMQNWQSEFLSIFSIVVFSIFLRQKGSPESKPVDASNAETED